MDKTRIILSGCNGKMGHVIRELVAEREDMEIAAGIDLAQGDAEFSVFTRAEECNAEADVIVDFSSSNALEGILSLATSRHLPVVLCSTGYSAEQLASIEAAAEKVAVFRSANMSLGINTVAKLIKEAAKLLANEGYDIEILEKHHNRKVDAPSGTAILLADAINEEFDNKYEYIYDRSLRREKRHTDEIGISSVRGGSIVGEHEVIFAGLDEVIEIKHTAYSRSVFAKGALKAAVFMKGKEPGMYSMKDATR